MTSNGVHFVSMASNVVRWVQWGPKLTAGIQLPPLDELLSDMEEIHLNPHVAPVGG